MRLQKHINDETNLFNLLVVLEMIDTCHQTNRLDEGAIESVKELIDKVKLFIKRATTADFWAMVEKDKNIAQHLYSFSADGARLLFHAFNAFYNNSEESKRYVKELSKTVNSSNFREILMKLDVMTLSTFSDPIKLIDVITGWKLHDALKKKLKPFDTQAQEAIKTLERLKNGLDNPAFKQQAQKYANALRRVFKIGDYKKVNETTVAGDIAAPDIMIGDGPVRRRLLTNKKLKKKKKKK